ncbi:MAG TPA: GMC family oxidoreductase [Povalibacter sp.]|nr:GMC family oxidoreductase [Povalibacter sp.]
MLIDGRNVPAGSELAADLCIVGAGPAGITLGCELRGKGCDVVILESGGLQVEPDSQALAVGEISGIGHVPLETARLRAFGGASGLWGGWCRPFDEIDFEERPWVPHSGWPIKRADLDPYYAQAQKICELGPFDYDPAHWHLESVPPLPLPDPDVRTRLVQFSTPTRFGERYRAPILSADNVRLCLHSNVVQLEPSDNGQRIERLHVATLDNNRFTIRARHYVLAAGGIENARLLLVSNQKINTGIGNQHDLVGRYFADHMQLDSAGVFPLRREMPFNLYLGEDRQVMRQPRADGTAVAVMGYFTLSAELQASQKILNYSCKMPRTSLGDYYLHTQSQGITGAPLRQKLTERARTLAGSTTEALSIASRRLLGKEHVFYKLVTTQEQAPNPDSRVLLGQSKDRLGVPVARLHWAMNELDRHTLKVGVERLARAFEASGIAHVQIPLNLNAHSWPSNIGCSWHHCGMTRMHSDPRKGVVDAHCRVHGVENLFIAGSSVFTTNGHGNPTLTVIALTLRLAARLEQTMAQ